MMEVRHLSRRFGGRLAVCDLTFDVREGDILGIVGPNGSGKTTTARLLAGVLEPTAGRITVYGRDSHAHSLDHRRLIGYLPEDAPAWGELRVREQLMQWGRIMGLSLRRCLQQMEWVLHVCGLESCLERRIETLSRGYRQRMGLATALLANPSVLILDEPTSGLDPEQAGEICRTILSLQPGRMILMATHRLEEAERICQRFLVLHNGRMVACDTLEELRKKAGDHETVYAEIRGPKERVQERCGGLLFVDSLNVSGEGEWVSVTLRHRPGTDIRADLYRLMVREGWDVRELRAERMPLQRVMALLMGVAK